MLSSKSIFYVCFSALILTATPLFAQTEQQSASDSIATYIPIPAIAELCRFNLAKPVDDATAANVKALQSKAKTSDAELGALYQSSLTELGKSKDKFCDGGQAKFDAMIPVFARTAETAAAAAGVKVQPIPANTAAQVAAPSVDKAKEAAKNMLTAAIMLEQISDLCGIDLTGKESLNIDRAQYLYRGQAGLSAAEVSTMTDALEEETKKSKDKVCAPSWGFKAAFEKMIQSIK